MWHGKKKKPLPFSISTGYSMNYSKWKSAFHICLNKATASCMRATSQLLAARVRLEWWPSKSFPHWPVQGFLLSSDPRVRTVRWQGIYVPLPKVFQVPLQKIIFYSYPQALAKDLSSPNPSQCWIFPSCLTSVFLTGIVVISLEWFLISLTAFITSRSPTWFFSKPAILLFLVFYFLQMCSTYFFKIIHFIILQSV